MIPVAWEGVSRAARQPPVVLDLEAAVAHPGDGLARQRLDVVEACRTSIERDCQGGRISTGVVELTGHQWGAPADGEAVAAGPASTGRASTAANADPGVQRGVGSGVASVGARGSNTSRLAGGVTYGTVTVSP
jgi:hypothetical protein